MSNLLYVTTCSIREHDTCRMFSPWHLQAHSHAPLNTCTHPYWSTHAGMRTYVSPCRFRSRHAHTSIFSKIIYCARQLSRTDEGKCFSCNLPIVVSLSQKRMDIVLKETQPIMTAIHNFVMLDRMTI